MDLVAGLNEPQAQAVTAQPGPVLVLAGPGSGKTRVLTHRIAYLIQALGVPPWRIMAVTFTNKAAREMRHRLDGLLGEPPRGLTMGTFHATCAGILRRESDNLAGYSREFVIFDSDDQRQVAKQALADLNLDDKRFPPAKMLNYISAAKNELITPEIYAATTYVSEVARRVYSRYQELLLANNAMDFDDLLLNTVLLFDGQPEVLAKYQRRYEHILVDEFQDTNSTQYALLNRLAAGHNNLFVVGDSDQSIYKWRGADIRNLRRFREQYPQGRMILLEQNYRSTQVILDAAKAVIRRNRERVDKELFTERQGGAPIVVRQAYDDREEAGMVVDQIAALVLEGLQPGDCAVMYRTNAQSRSLEEAFLQRGLPYKLVGATRFYSRREIKDLVAYLRLVHNPADSVSFGRVVNTPSRGIGKKTVEQLLAWTRRTGQLPAEALVHLATDPDRQHPFTARAFNALAGFGHLLHEWLSLRHQVEVGQLLDSILDLTGFQQYLEDGTPEGSDRWANVMEFRAVASAAAGVSLSEFLEQVALVSDVDDLQDENNVPTLLTLHAAKGLEFPVVFITGLEEGILPHARSFDSPEDIEEERRLFYVGLTRAKDRLIVSYALRRLTYGSSDAARPSRFLDDIPLELVEGDAGMFGAGPSPSADSSWRWPSGHAPAFSQTEEPPPSARRENHGPNQRRLRRPEPQTAFRTGQRVRHQKFGDGIVIESQMRGQEEEVTVAFASAGIKTLVASLANLENKA